MTSPIDDVLSTLLAGSIPFCESQALFMMCYPPCLQARLHVADDAAAAGLQSLAHLMARVQRAAAHAHQQGDTRLHTLHTHESDVSCPLPPPPPPP